MCLALLVVLLAALVLPAAAPASRAQAAPVRLRIGITADGIYQLTPAGLAPALAAAGVDPAAVDPRTFGMSSRGQPVAISVAGEADGHFTGNDRVLFFGQKYRGTEFQEKYTDEQVYWLDIGGTAGPRIVDLDATPQGNLTPPQDVAATVHAEVDMAWTGYTCL